MRRISFFSLTSAVPIIVLTSCAGVDPKVVPTLACSFANVIVKETDIPGFQEAFGSETGIGSRACKAIGILLTGDETGASEPATIQVATPLDIELPDGEVITVTLDPDAR